MAASIRDDDGVVNPSRNLHLTDLVERAIARSPSRRAVLKSGVGLAALSFLGVGLSACGSDDDGGDGSDGGDAGDGGDVGGDVGGGGSPDDAISFKSVGTSTSDAVVVPEGYVAEPLLRWGDPVLAGAPAWIGDGNDTWQAQEMQFGDNCDGNHFFALEDDDGKLRGDRGLFVTNHEYVNPEYFYAPGNDPANWLNPFTFDKAKKAIAGHGFTVAEVRRLADGKWELVRDSPYNRRVTGYTPIAITGPAAGSDLLVTAADPGATEVLGTLNNCAAGWTPWGTYLGCEENFNGYFGWNGARTPRAHESRYGLSQGGFGYRWHEVDPRFDVNANPNEPNRFGWVVELDPFNPSSKPKKRTALGRIKHENAEMVVATNGKVVVYTGDDERNEYIFKFVSAGTYKPDDAANNRDLLDAGTLHVAKFDAGPVAGDMKGTGSWIPLVWGENGLTAENGFANQAEVLIKARQAADRVGATMMDRPEWIAANPKKAGEVYCALTNNNRRGSSPASGNKADGTTVAGSARPPVDEANPRANNLWGHIIRWNEDGGDATATTFAWDIFLIAGNPKKYTDRTDMRSGSAAIVVDNQFNSPDGIVFDPLGRLWIQTDGSFADTGEYDGQGNNQMLLADVNSGAVKRFLVGPSGCEVTGCSFTPDMKTMFVGIQHPGEVGSHPNAPKKANGSTWGDNDIARDPTRFSTWPDGANARRPRASVIVVRRADGGTIGT